MRNELFTIGPLTVYGYGFMIAVGVIAAWIITNRRAEKQKLDHEHVFSLVIWCLLGGMFCAKILFWITEWKSIVQDPHYILDTISDGFVVYGGIIGGILAGCLYCYIKKTDFWKYFDLVIPSVALAQGFGRIGCLLAGCAMAVRQIAYFLLHSRIGFCTEPCGIDSNTDLFQCAGFRILESFLYCTS